MAKQGIISKHIVFSSAPNKTVLISGIILIQDELIYDVVVIDPSVSSSQILEQYVEWNIEDLSDLHISPGVIDLNTRLEWESYANLSRAAVSGGVTLALVEESHYNSSPLDDRFYCDVAKVAIVKPYTVSSIPSFSEQGYFAVKGYLYPPCRNIQDICEVLPELLIEIEKTPMLLIIEPNLPHERMLHSASPFRLRSIEDRLRTDIPEISKFSGAFPDMITSNGDEEDASGTSVFENREGKEKEDSMDTPLLIVSSVSSVASNKNSPITPENNETPLLTVGSINTSSKNSPVPLGREESDIPQLKVSSSLHGHSNKNSPMIPLNEEVKFLEDKKPGIRIFGFPEVETKLKTLQRKKIIKSSTYADVDELDKRIRKSQMTLQNLSLAEYHSYKESGQTNYSGSLSPGPLLCLHSEHSAGSPSSSSPSPSILERRRVSGTFSLLVTSQKPKEMPYNCHMACYSPTWEIEGIEKILHNIKNFQGKIHISGISAAAAFNKIRKSKDFFLKITSEIPASHLLFNNDCIQENDTRFKNSPPFRDEVNTTLLWDLLKMNGINAVSSAHCCIHPSFKRIGGSFQRALNGLPTAGVSLQTMWTVINKNIDKNAEKEKQIIKLAKFLSSGPAEILNISEARGSITKGKFADFIVWDPYVKHEITHDYSQFPNMSPFIGKEVYGKIEKVYVRGQVAFNQGNFEPKGRVYLRNT